MVFGETPDRFLGGNKCPGSFHLTSDEPLRMGISAPGPFLLQYETHFAPVMLLFPGPISSKSFGLETVADNPRRPPSRRKTREQRAARSILWVTTTEVK